MSWGYSSPFGRWSPFSAQPARSPPAVTADSYSYMTPDDIVEPDAAYNQTRAPAQQAQYHNDTYFPPASARGPSRHATLPVDDDDDGPDILVCRWKGRTYPLHFEPFSIGEGLVRVGQVREKAAQAMDVGDPRRVTLLYKGKKLKDDAVAAKEEGLKQNSELMCVVSEAVLDGSDSDESASEEELRAGLERRADRGAREEGESGARRAARKGHRGGKKGRKRDGVMGADLDEGGSATGSSTSAHTTSFDPNLPTLQENPARAKLDALAALEAKFKAELRPMCEEYIKRPPRDSKSRDFEYKKLCESLMQQITLKADGIEPEGRDDVRKKRKGLTTEVQQMYDRLDKAHKSAN